MSTRPIRVAHLIQYFTIGGLERMVERLAVASQSKGVESVVIGYLGDGPIRKSLEAEGVPTLLLDTTEGLHPARILELAKVLKRERIDILHSHHVGPFIYGAPAAILAGCKRVHTEHSHELYDNARRRLLGAAMSPLAKVVAVAPEVADYRKRFPGECLVIPNGVPMPAPDPELRHRGRAELGADEDSFVIGCAARLTSEKNHAGLLQAFEQLAARFPNAILACAGDGPLAGALKEQTERAGLGSRVRWLGALESMAEFYSALDVCVLNSVREGLPLCLLEAMSYAVPVVATSVGGVPELLEGGAGRLVPSESPQAMAEALGELAADPERTRDLGRAGHERVQEEYSIGTMVDRYIELYRELVPGPLRASRAPSNG